MLALLALLLGSPVAALNCCTACRLLWCRGRRAGTCRGWLRPPWALLLQALLLKWPLQLLLAWRWLWRGRWCCARAAAWEGGGASSGLPPPPHPHPKQALLPLVLAALLMLHVLLLMRWCRDMRRVSGRSVGPTVAAAHMHLPLSRGARPLNQHCWSGVRRV